MFSYYSILRATSSFNAVFPAALKMAVDGSSKDIAVDLCGGTGELLSNIFYGIKELFLLES